MTAHGPPPEHIQMTDEGITRLTCIHAHAKHSLESAMALQDTDVLNRTLSLKQPTGQAKIEHVLKSDVTFLQKEVMIV